MRGTRREVEKIPKMIINLYRNKAYYQQKGKVQCCPKNLKPRENLIKNSQEKFITVFGAKP